MRLSPFTVLADEHLKIVAPSYSLEFRTDRPYAIWRDHTGQIWSALFLGGSFDSQEQADESWDLSAPSYHANGQTMTVEFAITSSLWQRKRLFFELAAERFDAWFELEGRGKLDKASWFGGAFVDTKRGAFPFYSRREFETVFNPEARSAELALRPATEPAVLNMLENGLGGNDGSYFTPGPLCWVVGREPNQWTAVGVVTKPGQNQFVELGYEPRGSGFRVTALYQGHASVRGVWESPRLRFLPGAGSPYAAVARFVDSLSSAAKREQPNWWREPIFCGWGEQTWRAAAAKLPPGELATQANHDAWLDELERQGVVPGTIVIDDKWQQTYGENEADHAKWPDLADWIRRRHARGQRVLLWLKAWDVEGLDPALCARTPAGRAVSTDPSNPAYAVALTRQVERMLLDYGADGFKIDFTAKTPFGSSLVSCGDEWGLELLHRLLEIIYSAAKRVKPEALIVTQTPNPYLADVTDMIRLNDIDSAGAVSAQMLHRAMVVQATCPELLIDTDNWFIPTVKAWREYLAFQPSLGVPALYYATGLTPQQQFKRKDYRLLAATWAEYRAQVGLKPVHAALPAARPATAT